MWVVNFCLIQSLMNTELYCTLFISLLSLLSSVKVVSPLNSGQIIHVVAFTSDSSYEKKCLGVTFSFPDDSLLCLSSLLYEQFSLNLLFSISLTRISFHSRESLKLLKRFATLLSPPVFSFLSSVPSVSRFRYLLTFRFSFYCGFTMCCFPEWFY